VGGAAREAGGEARATLSMTSQRRHLLGIGVQR